MDTNSIVISGRIAQDMELRSTGKDPVTNIRLAHSAGKDASGNDKTVWIDVSLWGATAENTVKYLSKGDKVVVTGRLEQRTYTNKEGKDVTTTEIKAYQVEFPVKGSTGDGGGGSAPSHTSQAPKARQDDYVFEPNDSLPF
jgi:single-strand DNA-binding protein